jgi:hypothetical protein
VPDDGSGQNRSVGGHGFKVTLITHIQRLAVCAAGMGIVGGNGLLSRLTKTTLRDRPSAYGSP